MPRSIVLNIDSKYRLNYHNTASSDFSVNLNYPLTKVTSMKLSNIQLPNTWHNISDKYKNNYIIIDGFKFTLPNGNYDSKTLSNILKPLKDDNGIITFGLLYTLSVDIHNGQCTINKTNSTNLTISLRSPDDNSDIKESLGWLCGFRQASYNGSSSYTGKSIFNMGAFTYLYMVVDDFNINSSELIVGNLESSHITGNILGIIRINTGNYRIVNTDSYETQTRKYAKPAGITKLHIKLMDPDGDIIDLNYMDFSFSLEFTLKD